MIKKILGISGKIMPDVFRSHLIDLDFDGMEEIYDNVWMFYDNSQASSEIKLRLFLEQLSIVKFSIEAED